MHTDIFDCETQAEAARALALEDALTNSIATCTSANERTIILYTTRSVEFTIVEIRTCLYALFARVIHHILFTMVIV